MITYRVSPVFRLPGFKSFLMENHYCGRLWTGYEVRDEQSAGTVFYLTENAQVFHRDRECSHLRLSVEAISRQQLPDAVNNDRSHYRACEVCTGTEMPEKLWIAKEGDCYHYRRDCPGLKRTIREADWEEAGRYRPCSRCGFTGGSQ